MTEKHTKTLKEEDVVTEKKVGRRSLLSIVAGGVIGGTALAVGMPSGASAGKPGAGIEGCTDNDQGTNSDPAANGRGNGRSDNDQGSNSDPAGCARSPQR